MESNVTENMASKATRKRKKANVYASMYCKPIFMAGKEVPHIIPAAIVNRTPLFLLPANKVSPSRGILFIFSTQDLNAFKAFGAELKLNPFKPLSSIRNKKL